MSSVQYYIWTSSYSSAYLAGRGSRGQRAVIVVQPCAGCHLTVQYFNLSLDVIDLTAFSDYHTLRDLNVSGHTTITLVDHQVLLLLNMDSGEVLTEENFKFVQEEIEKNLSNHNLVLFGCLFGAIAGIGFLVKYYFAFRQWRKEQKVAADLIARQKPLVTHTHSVYKHTLVGKRQRPSMFEVREVNDDEEGEGVVDHQHRRHQHRLYHINEEQEEDEEEDSLLEHMSNHKDSSDEATVAKEEDKAGKDDKGRRSSNKDSAVPLNQKFPANYDEDFHVYRQRILEKTQAEEWEDYDANEEDDYFDAYNWHFGADFIDEEFYDENSIASDSSLRITWCTAV